MIGLPTTKASVLHLSKGWFRRGILILGLLLGLLLLLALGLLILVRRIRLVIVEALVASVSSFGHWS